MRTLSFALAVAATAAVLSTPALAGDSPWTVKVGLSGISPKSGSGTLTVPAGTTETEISSEVNLTPAIEYKFAPNLVGEVLLALPYTHDVKFKGGSLNLGSEKNASFKHLPPTVTLKYLFAPEATFSPYVGAGINYTIVWGEKTYGTVATVYPGLQLDADNSFGLAATAGFEYRLPNSPWGVTMDVRYIKIESDLKVKNGGKLGTLTVDPLVVGLSGAYHF